MMKQVIAIIRSEKWGATRAAIEGIALQELSQRRVVGRGKQRGLRYLRRASDSGEGDMPFLPKRMFACYVEDADCDALVSAVIKVNQTGNVGDGKIFIRPVELLQDQANTAPAGVKNSVGQ